MKKKIIISSCSFFCLLTVVFLWSKIVGTKADAVVHEENNPYEETRIKTIIFPLENGTFGYDIYKNDSVLIHQPSRPGVSGNIGFKTEEDALKVAELVIKKILNNEIPPTITKEELQDLKVL